MTETTNKEASTLHRLLEIGKFDEESFYKNEKIDKKIKILFTIFYHIPATYNMFRWINEKRVR